MAQSLVLALAQCSLLSALLWYLVQRLQLRLPALRQWPAFYWFILALSFSPLLPLPEVALPWHIPSVLLQDALSSLQSLSARPEHPAIAALPLSWQLVWPFTLALMSVVSLWQLLRVGRQWQQLQQIIRLAEPLPASALLNQAQCAQLPSGFSVRQTPLTLSPFIAGCWQMVLVVPEYIWQLSPASRQLLIVHELEHLQRRDARQLLLMRLLVALCWFMPTLRYLERAFGHSIELAVDKAVLQQQPEQAALYGQTLLHSLALSQQGFASPLTASFGQGSADKLMYQQRLTALFQPVAPFPLIGKYGVILLFGAVLLAMQFGVSALKISAPAQPWQLPVTKAVVSSGYAELHPFRQYKPHQGIDFAAAKGVPVKASQSGTVLIADSDSLHSNYGQAVLINHGGGYQSLYAHLNAFYVQPGQRVRAGQTIGAVGESGRVTGPHLHFEILRDGVQLNPALYLQPE